MFIIVTNRVSASLARTASGSSSRVVTSTNGMTHLLYVVGFCYLPLPEASLWRVLHHAVAERPVFPGVVDEIDPDVFFSYAGPLMNLIGYPFIEFFLRLDGPAGDPGNLN